MATFSQVPMARQVTEMQCEQRQLARDLGLSLCHAALQSDETRQVL